MLLRAAPKLQWQGKSSKIHLWQLATNKWMYVETNIFIDLRLSFSKVLQHILNPAFLHSFEKGEGEQLLGPPNPEGDNPDSITSVFITKVDTCFQTSSQTASL